MPYRQPPPDPSDPIHVQRGYGGYWGHMRMEAHYGRAEKRWAREDRCGPSATSRIAAVRDMERVRCSAGCGSYVWAEPGETTMCDWCERQEEAGPQWEDA